MQIVVLKSLAFYKAQMLIESCNEEYQIFYEILLWLVVLFMLETMLPKNGEMVPKGLTFLATVHTLDPLMDSSYLKVAP
jgi:hypothetical protein